MKKAYCFLLTLVVVFSMIGCSSKDTTSITGSTTADVESVKPVKEETKQEQPEPKQPECGANSNYSELDGSCVCEEGYVEAEDGCEPEPEECTKDEDCSPSGDVARECIDMHTAKIYECDTETNKCIPKKGKAASYDDCRRYSDHLCANGYCVET
jgi:hypothetical protein